MKKIMENLSVDVLLKGVFILSVVINLTTQGIKKLLDDAGKKYSSNIVAAVVAVIAAIAIAIIYCVIKAIPFDGTVVAITVIMIWLSFILATNGYDKIKQLIEYIFGK